MPLLRAMAIGLGLSGLPLLALAEAHDDALCQPTLAPRADGPQVADTEFEPAIADPAYAAGRGPLVLLDEAHFNFHTLEGRYAPFAALLRRDGFVVEPLRERLSPETLAGARVLVIANALAERNGVGEWNLPTPSAFAAGEIEAVRQWVAGGGSLFLIADHMPFPGAAANLAAAFGILFTNGYATDETCSEDEFLFQRADESLARHPVTEGRGPGERVHSVRTITGQAFRVVAEASPILLVRPRSVILMPAEAWEFNDQTPRLPGDGMLQGAVLSYGHGRVAVFGEASMFSAQVSGLQRRPMGMNMPTARGNPQLLLNIMHWLVGLLPES